MKSKTSITLSEDVVKTIDRTARRGESRSAAIERLVRAGLTAEARRTTNARDRILLDRLATALNAEMDDVLDYQAEL